MIKNKKMSKLRAVAILKNEFPDLLNVFYRAIILDSLDGARWYKELAD